MGCQGSKEGAAPGTAPAGEAKSSLLSATPDKGVPGKGAKTPQSTSSSDEVDNRRKSVIHKAPEYIGGRVDLTAPFDKATIGTFTRHGIAPARLANANSKAAAMSGFSMQWCFGAAKIRSAGAYRRISTRGRRNWLSNRSIRTVNRPPTGTR